MSEDVKVVERFALNEDQTELAFQITIVDPLTFTEPAHPRTFICGTGRRVSGPGLYRILIVNLGLIGPERLGRFQEITGENR